MYLRVGVRAGMADVVQVSVLRVLRPILERKLLLLSSEKKELCPGVCRNGDRGSAVVNPYRTNVENRVSS